MHSSQQVRRPLVGVSLSIVAGLFLQQSLDLAASLSLASAAFFIAVLCRGPARNPTARMYAACILIAAAYSAVEQTHIPARAAVPLAEIESSRQEMVGIVLEEPAFSEEYRTWTFRFKAEAVRIQEEWHRSDTEIRVRIKEGGAEVVYGERWRLTGRYRSYERTYGGMAGAFSVQKTDAVKVRSAKPSLRGLCYKLRSRARPVFEEGMRSFNEHTRLVQALLLGYRNTLPEHLYRVFSRTGMLHIFAISGLHVGVMAAILIAGLKITGVAKPQWAWFLIPLLFLYVVSTGMKPSAFRAFVMAAVYFAAPLVCRRPDSATAIALAAIILLCLNPLQLGDPGFLLSFTVVCGIVMVHAYVVRKVRGFNRPGWTAPLVRVSGTHPVKALGRATGLLLLTSVAAWVFSAPLSARFFNTVSPIAVPGNLVMIPFTFMIILTGCMSLIAAPVAPALTIIFNHANRIFVGVLIAAAQTLGAVPGASCYVRAPSGWVMAGWYAGLTLSFCGPKRWRRPGVLLTLCAALVWVADLPGDQQEELALNRGETFFSFQAEGRRIVVAEGHAYSISRSTRWLKEQGINRVQELAVTGMNVDVQNLRDLCRTFSAHQLWLPTRMKGTPEAEALGKSGIRIVYADKASWTAGDGAVAVNLGY